MPLDLVMANDALFFLGATRQVTEINERYHTLSRNPWQHSVPFFSHSELYEFRVVF